MEELVKERAYVKIAYPAWRDKENYERDSKRR